jgi:HD-GYP domain-containing protein (c-di-GMP phosphodiesterase class II)
MTASSEYYDLVRHLVSALHGRRIYPPQHPALERTLARIEQALHHLMVNRDEIQLGVLGSHLLADGLPWEEQGESYTALSRELKSQGIDKLTFQRGFSRADLESLLEVLMGDRARGDLPGDRSVSVAHLLAGRGVSRIRVAHLDLESEAPQPPAETAGDRGAYDDALGRVTETLECARDGRLIRVKQVQSLVEMLMEHMQRDPGPLLMLTALKSHSDYTFTHTVNVAILTLALVQAISRDSDVIREYGIAAMMHDLGKMRVPTEILNKRGKLTDSEFDIIRRHPVDTLQILRETPGSSDLTLVVGFEHHRRFDLTGYPVLKRPLPQHFASRLCTVADAYDAMRSNRSYQKEMLPEQAMEILKQQSGKMFDPALVRLFIRMMGAYPPGTRVRLGGGEEAIVLRANPEDPLHPIVRLLGGAGGTEGDPLRLVNLAERDPKSGSYLHSVRESLLDSRPAT